MVPRRERVWRRGPCRRRARIARRRREARVPGDGREPRDGRHDVSLGRRRRERWFRHVTLDARRRHDMRRWDDMRRIVSAPCGVSTSMVRSKSRSRTSTAARPDGTRNRTKLSSSASKASSVRSPARTKARGPSCTSTWDPSPAYSSSPGASGVFTFAGTQPSAPGRQNDTSPSRKLTRGGAGPAPAIAARRRRTRALRQRDRKRQPQGWSDPPRAQPARDGDVPPLSAVGRAGSMTPMRYQKSGSRGPGVREGHPSADGPPRSGQVACVTTGLPCFPRGGGAAAAALATCVLVFFSPASSSTAGAMPAAILRRLRST